MLYLFFQNSILYSWFITTKNTLSVLASLLQINESFLSTLHDFVPLIVSNILVIGFFLFFQNNSDKAKSKFEVNIAKLEARSLKAQMDPHFIFNAINGIQSLLLL